MAITDNLISYWKLDEVSGNRADSHGSSTLIDVNTVASATGVLNLGADFEGGNSEYFTVADSVNTRVDDGWSFSFWIKRESIGATHYLFYQRSGENGFSAGFTTGNKLFITCGSGTFGGSGESTATFTSTSAFYHVVIIPNGAASKIYINGTLDSTITCNAITPPNTELNIGTLHTHASGFLDGILDEVGMWSRALTAPEVTSLYNGGAGFAYPFVTSPIKTVNGLAKASIKTINGA